jgi:hypothetical protein
MKVHLSQNPDVLGRIQVQSRNQQRNQLARGKKLFPFLSGCVMCLTREKPRPLVPRVPKCPTAPTSIFYIGCR